MCFYVYEPMDMDARLAWPLPLDHFIFPIVLTRQARCFFIFSTFRHVIVPLYFSFVCVLFVFCCYYSHVRLLYSAFRFRTIFKKSSSASLHNAKIKKKITYTQQILLLAALFLVSLTASLPLTHSNGYDFIYKNRIFLNIACNYQYQ